MDETEKILVSVVMPAYNAEKYIANAIDSVMGQGIAQPVELLVVDDCSEDGTGGIVRERIRRYRQSPLGNRRLRYFRNERNLGVAESRNVGIRNAGGSYIAFLDADDWWDPGKLEKQMLLLEQTNAVLCATGRELMNADGTSTGKVVPIPARIGYSDLLRTNYIPCSSAVLRTDVAREFYMCHDELHEDYILWLRVLQKYGSAVGIDEPLLKCRMSEDGKSRNKLKSAKMHYGVYRYMGMGVVRSFFYMFSYIFHGIVKYSRFSGGRSGMKRNSEKGGT